ncbi:PAS domain-containing protein [Nitrospira lenta]|uniref:Oxygen sensor histidine kinase NreB n=1 Tax=Nitrospira lenta TaxID=1436998 RepID=A0A330L225_9BACT|nr:PAS domain-containing protein [Nitrospira lenta]SPP63790.1 putative Histidine kinase [Nitrospira lenta]
MVIAPIPSRESARLEALYRSRILNTPSEPAFDELAQLAAYVCQAPIAVISFVDSTRLSFKSVVGLSSYTPFPRSRAFCAHTILGTDLFIVDAADADERFRDHPWVVASPSIRFYAGAPLLTPDGHALGALAVMDTVPRALTSEQGNALRTLAKQVVAQLELRRGGEAGAASVESSPATAFLQDPNVGPRVNEERSKRDMLCALMLNTGPGCIKRVAADGTLLHMNPAGLSLIEVCREEEVVGCSVFDLVLPEYREAFMRMHHDVIGGASRTLQFKVQGFQGTRRWLETHAVPFHNPVTGGTEQLAITYDISERKQTEEALRLSQEQLHLALQASNTGLWDWNTETGEVCYSKEWKSQIGYDETELANGLETWASRLHPDDRDRAILYAQRYPANPVGVYQQDFRLRHKDGSYRWFDSHASFVTEDDGRKIRLLGSHTDITARKEMEQALAESEQRFALAAAGANDALWDMHIRPGESWESATPVWWSPRTRMILDLEESEPFDLVSHWASRLHPDDKERVFNLLTAHLDRRIPYEIEYRLRTSHGDYRWIYARGQATWDEFGIPRRISGSCKNITDRKIRESLIVTENDLLNMIATNAALPAILTTMCRALEVCLAESFCSILLLDHDGTRLWHGAWPSLPEAYVRAIDGAAIGPAAGSCGTAAATKQRIIVSDIAADPLWENYRELALSHGLQACWSTPILAADGAVLGTVAVYWARPRYPKAVDLELVDRASHMASIAIERTRAADKLRLTQFCIDHATDAFYLVDQHARIGNVNHAACAMLGYTVEEFRQMTVPDINPHFAVVSWPDFWVKLKRTGTTSIQSEHCAKDGRRIPVEVNVQFLQYEGREYSCAFVRDVSQRRHDEQALRGSEERFRLVAEATNDILWDWDLVTQEHWWSPNAREKFGYDSPEAPSLAAWADRLHPEDRSRILAVIDAALASEVKTVTAEYRFRLADGSYGYFFDRGQIVRDAAGRPLRMIGAMIDVTFSKRAYASLEAAYQRLQSLSRELQVVESNERRRLSRELHDEVGQLLTALKFDLEATRQALGETSVVSPARARERTRCALETTDELFVRLRRIVRALRPSVLEALGLKEALEALVSEIQSRSDLVCSISIEAEAVETRANSTIEAALYRMAQELVTNVVRHAQAMTMSVVLTVDAQGWMLTIQDDGIGFDPQAESSSGMGIRGVCERAEILGGRVDVTSSPGAGSTVTVWIPVAEPAPEKAGS